MKFYGKTQLLVVQDMRGSRGGKDMGSGPPPLKNHKYICFLRNTGTDPSGTYDPLMSAMAYPKSIVPIL